MTTPRLTEEELAELDRLCRLSKPEDFDKRGKELVPTLLSEVRSLREEVAMLLAEADAAQHLLTNAYRDLARLNPYGGKETQ